MPDKNYPNIAARVLNTPLLLEPGYARVFFSALSGRLGIQQLKDVQGEIITGEKLHVTASSYNNNRDRNRPYQVMDGIAVIPVTGTLVHKLGSIQPYSGMTGYDGLIYCITDAVNDPEITGIMLDIDSPGGEVAGCFDCSDMIFKLGQLKPIASLCYDMNCSAAQAIASATSRRYITQNGRAGSIGVLMAHSSHEKALDEIGINVTLIHSGKYKVDGNPYEDLSAEVLSRFQQETDNLRQLFATKVSLYTGLSLQAVLDTEAKIYRGQESIDVGLSDEVVNGIEAIDVFRDYLGQSPTSSTNPNSTGETMSVERLRANANSQPAAGNTDPESAPAETEQAAATEQQPQATATDERARIQSILKCEAATGRSEMAEHLAFNTTMSVEDSKSLLAVAPKQAESAASGCVSALDQAMAREEAPNLSADNDDAPEQNSDEQMIQQALAAHSAATGKTYNRAQ